MNNDEKILKALETLQAGQTRLEKGQAEQGQAIAQVKTGVKALATKQDVEAAKTELKADIKKVRTEMATKADVLDVGVKIDKMKRRIEILEEDADLPNPHKN